MTFFNHATPESTGAVVPPFASVSMVRACTLIHTSPEKPFGDWNSTLSKLATGTAIPFVPLATTVPPAFLYWKLALVSKVKPVITPPASRTTT